jgi:hypothetical protein
MYQYNLRMYHRTACAWGDATLFCPLPFRAIADSTLGFVCGYFPLLAYLSIAVLLLVLGVGYVGIP